MATPPDSTPAIDDGNIKKSSWARLGQNFNSAGLMLFGRILWVSFRVMSCNEFHFYYYYSYY
jgi:hypothetical protein